MLLTCACKCERVILQGIQGVSVCRSDLLVLLLLDSMLLVYNIFQTVQSLDMYKSLY